MTAIEIKEEIKKVLDKLSEQKLTTALELIKQLELDDDTRNTIRKIIDENRNLFHRLAQ